MSFNCTGEMMGNRSTYAISRAAISCAAGAGAARACAATSRAARSCAAISGAARSRVVDFLRQDCGAALVEFAILLPMLLLVFAVMIEGGRLMWSYQTTVAGVRDAARYLARVASSDICITGAGVSSYTGDLENIVRNSVSGDAIFPSGITVNSVTPSISCIAGTYRVSPAPIAQVTASLTITFPFASVFSLAGQSLGTITTTVTDQSKVFGT
jgi:Flp pilus assembly protein TadG